MLKYIARRFLFSVVTLLILSLVVFIGVELLPGDLATAFLGREATPTSLASLRAELGLDRPVLERYVNWLGDALHGDLGVSLARNRPVNELIGVRMRNTLLLGLTGLTRDRKPDLWISTIALVLMTLPEFVTATLLILLFAITWPILPAVTIVGTGAPIKEMLPNIVLPVVTLAFVMVAHNLRMVRTNVIDVMKRLCSDGDPRRSPI